MFFRILYIIPLIANALIALSQEIDEKNFTLYTKLNGLSQNYVNAIAQDSTGYIWIATNKGLNRFDGKSFINFFKNSENSPLPDNKVDVLHIQQNEIIGSTIGGAFTFHAVTGKYKKFIVPADSIFFFWANRVFDALKDSKGNYVVSTKTGLFVFNDSGKIICRYDHHVSSDVGRVELWFGNWLKALDNGTVFQQNGLSGSLYNPQRNRIDTFFSIKKFKRLNYRSPLKAGDTSSSFGGYRDEMFFVDVDQSSIHSISINGNTISSSILAKNIISDFNWQSKSFIISDTTIAVTSKIGGFYLFHYDAVSKKIITTGKKYFASKYCTSIFKDRDQRLWIGTNDGLYRQNLRNPFFTTEDISLQLPDIVNTGIQSVYVEEDKIFLGLRNAGGILILDKTTKKVRKQISFASLGEGSNTVIYIFSYHPDTLWLGTGNSIVWLNKRNFSYGNLSQITGQPPWMKNERCRTYLQDSRGNIWLSFGRLNSVVLFDRGQHKFAEITSPLLRITFCFSMKEDKRGNVWLAGDGFCRYNIQKKMIDTLIPYPPVRKSQYNFIEILAADDSNSLWLTAENEIIQYNYADNQMWLRLEENNIPDGYLVASSPVINDHIWMCLANGIAAFHIKDYTVKQFNYADGLPDAAATSLRQGSFYDQQENLFYFGAGHYFISFHPDVSQPGLQPVPKFFAEVVSSTGQVLQTPDVIRMPHSQNDFQLRFNVINFTDPEDNRYSYRMINDKDTNWHDLNTQSTIALNDLSFGSYHIQARLSSVNNRWPEQIKDVRIKIVPPFWKTTWFLLSLVILTSTVLYFLYRFRIGRIRQKANLDKLIAETEMKALHSQMNPHFIFNCLNSIREMILNNENNQASLYLSKFARLIRITLNHSSNTFVSLEDTIDYLRRYLEMERIRTSNFSYTIDIAPDLHTHQILLPPMLIQPFIENAIWHGASPGKKMHVKIHFKTEQRELICIVEDDGIGIRNSLKNKEPEINYQSVGISNVRQRMQVLNEKYNLRSTVEIADKAEIYPASAPGTIVTLRLPLQVNEP